VPQSGDQSPKRPDGNPAWIKGVSGNPAGRESRATREARIADKLEEWAAPFGGIAVFNAAEIDLLRQAAELSLRRWRTADDQLRIARTISKLLAQVGIVAGAAKRKIEPADPFAPLLDVPPGAASGGRWPP
jgi:hypothetical protein